MTTRDHLVEQQCQLDERRRLHREHNCSGRCSGRLRIAAGRLVRELVCDDCGTVNQTLPTIAYHAPAIAQAA